MIAPIPTNAAELSVPISTNFPDKPPIMNIAPQSILPISISLSMPLPALIPRSLFDVLPTAFAVAKVVQKQGEQRTMKENNGRTMKQELIPVSFCSEKCRKL